MFLYRINLFKTLYFLITSLSLQSSVNNKAGTVQEDALEAVATLVEVLGAEFIKYMEVSVFNLPYKCLLLKASLI